jgi:hypothetical protein
MRALRGGVRVTDIDWLYLLIACYRGFDSQSGTNNERKNEMATYKNTIRETFEATIRRKLENPDIPASEVESLARAYSELTKNENLREMMRNVSGLGTSIGVSGNG